MLNAAERVTFGVPFTSAGWLDLMHLFFFISQEILLMKGEGEVKLNMAIGKGEQALRSSNEEGQKVIQTQLQKLKDVWNDIISNSVSLQR